MSWRVQVRNENVREKIFLWPQIGMSFYESKIQILEGLYLKESSMYLLGRNHVDEDNLLSDMLEYERLDTSRSVRFRQVTSTKEVMLQKSVKKLVNYMMSIILYPIKSYVTRILILI